MPARARAWGGEEKAHLGGDVVDLGRGGEVEAKAAVGRGLGLGSISLLQVTPSLI